ncbi:arsenate reductase (azurin) small subunit [Sorangium sp. So ce1024]|uniref:arsenate reductase (azurin) small subunit n=1 Tax=unclassified Sorangium TaxID=2621164 RepID=UPI003F0E5A53
MSKTVTRRIFLQRGTVLGAAVATSIGCSKKEREPGPAPAYNMTLPYPESVVAKAASLAVGKAHFFQYPDPASPCMLLKMGRRSTGGVGVDGDIVAYSMLCAHQGCPLAYDEERSVLKCHCHFSMFDPERGGQMLSGQATTNLPQVLLSYREQDDSVIAVGMTGLLYGRASNVI